MLLKQTPYTLEPKLKRDSLPSLDSSLPSHFTRRSQSVVPRRSGGGGGGGASELSLTDKSTHRISGPSTAFESKKTFTKTRHLSKICEDFLTS